MKLYPPLLFMALCLLCPVIAVAAHGGGDLQVANAPVGYCLVSVWSAPPAPRAGTPLHITVGVAEKVDRSPRLDAAVQVAIRQRGTQAFIVTVPATTGQSSNRLFYEADVPALAAGNYEVVVTTTCGDTADSVAFNLQVGPARQPTLLIVALVAGALLLGGFLFRLRRRQTAVSPVKKR